MCVDLTVEIRTEKCVSCVHFRDYIKVFRIEETKNTVHSNKKNTRSLPKGLPQIVYLQYRYRNSKLPSKKWIQVNIEIYLVCAPIALFRPSPISSADRRRHSTLRLHTNICSSRIVITRRTIIMLGFKQNASPQQFDEKRKANTTQIHSEALCSRRVAHLNKSRNRNRRLHASKAVQTCKQQTNMYILSMHIEKSSSPARRPAYRRTDKYRMQS